MDKRLSLVCSLVLGVFCVSSSVAASLCGARAAAVEFAIDASSSMGESYARPQFVNDEKEAALWGNQSTKLAYAQQFVKMAAEKINPTEEMVTGLATFMPSSQILKTQKRTGEAFSKSLSEVKISASTQSLNNFDKKALDYFARKRKEPTTLFVITDGDIDKGSHDPAKVLQTFYQNNPKSCVHLISLAQTDSEKEVITRLRRVNACSTMATVVDMMADRQKFNAMVEGNVYRNCSSQEDLEVAGIPFVKKSTTLDKKAIAVLDQVMEVIAQRPKDESMLILGWTDTEGDAAFNKRLGLQRAKVVKDYLVSKGVEDHRMAVMGGGESEKFDNTTEAGRKLNRRVDIIFGQ